MSDGRSLPRGSVAPRDRFMLRVSRCAAGCWTWLGPLDKDGYGEWSNKGVRMRAHRWAYEMFVGQFNRALQICHRCDNPSCVNPAHLFVGTQRQNMQDMVAKGRKAPKFGEHHHCNKLTDEIVLAMRARHTGRRGETTRIAAEFGFGYRVTRDAITRRRWRHLP